MGYLGNSNVVQNFTPAVDYFNGNGSATAFTLSRTVGSAFDIQAFIENVPQNPSSAFTVAGNVITFTSAPPSGTNNIYVRYTSPVVQQVKPAPGTVGTAEITSSVTLTTPLISGNLNFDSTGTSGIRLPSANTLAFHTAGTEDMRIDSSGNLLVGGTDSNPLGNGGTFKNLLVYPGSGYAAFQGITTATATGSTAGAFSAGTIGASAYKNLASINIEIDGTSTTNGVGRIAFYTATGGSILERMRIDSEGYFLMAPTYRTVPRGRVDISAPGNSVGGLPTVCLAMSRWGDAGPMVNFFSTHESTTSIGNITNQGGTNTQYNTSSDYRLKENIAPMTGALAKVTLLKPCTYTWKSTGDDGQGFIAHELQEVFPDAVYGEKDAVDTEGNVVSQGVDTSYLVATLTAAIQEQQAIIEDLKTRIEILENK